MKKGERKRTEQPPTSNQISYWGWLMQVHRFGLYLIHSFLEIEGTVCDTTSEACMEWCRRHMSRRDMSRLCWLIQSRGPNAAAEFLQERGAPMVQPVDDPMHV